MVARWLYLGQQEDYPGQCLATVQEDLGDGTFSIQFDGGETYWPQPAGAIRVMCDVVGQQSQTKECTKTGVVRTCRDGLTRATLEDLCEQAARTSLESDWISWDSKSRCTIP